MKKIIALILVSLFALTALVSCGVTDDPHAASGDPSDIPYASESVTIYSVSNTSFGKRISLKRIAGSGTAHSIISSLNGMAENGELTDGVSDAEFDIEADGEEIPVEISTYWIEAGSVIYRIDPQFDAIWRVDGFYGKGYGMTIPEGFRELIVNAWYYYPYDYYSAAYTSSTGEITVTHTFAAESDVTIDVESITLVSEREYPENPSRIVLKLTSAVDKTVNLGVSSYQSDDNLGDDSGATVELKAGKPKLVEMTFYNFTYYSYWLDVSAGNTFLHILINPN
ncbi:MAG: hypothetical protein J5793_02820 [Clostridia bacterium]|nr:hypothetical protein [Clostridia bacterium]